jgi:hypothetical protein
MNKTVIQFIYREQIRQPEDRYLSPKLRESPFTLLNNQVSLSWYGDVSGPVQVEIGDLCDGAMTFAFHKDVQISIDDKPFALSCVQQMEYFPEWEPISRRLANGVFVLPTGNVYVDPEEAVDEYLSKCERAGDSDVRLPDGTLLPIARLTMTTPEKP